MMLRTRTPVASASTRGRAISRTPSAAQHAEADHGGLVAALEVARAVDRSCRAARTRSA